ncbi:serine hydrolase [Longimycelium tulufanense]|uniref:Serine hydrolase n=1 Tax=Longimycelium tulufanense TaxID=907463 RepID=A0A8J3CAF9_9PSEU|nr:serine hydrolase [Longimycelium tulufanense]GGM65427.1 serine hydrolase [Longimycelium tulufanense]
MRALVFTLVALLTMTAGASAAHPDDRDSTGRFDRPRPGFASPLTVLREGTPESVRLDPRPLAAALRRIKNWTEGSGSVRPMFAGAVSLVAHDGVIVRQEAAGFALRYREVRPDGSGVELPRDQWIPARDDTIFDVASVTKLFTSIVVMQQVEAGRIDLQRQVAQYLPEFAANGKESIPVEWLLTHRSGLPPFLLLWKNWPDKPARIRAVLEAAPQEKPGTKYIYSDLNLIALGVLAERVSGQPLDELVRQGITEPLGMSDTGYNPSPEVRNRVAATEFVTDPPRGLVHGEVHDENAWSLGGVAGHAGIFSTARDLAVLGQAILNGGTYRGRQILRPDTVEDMLTNRNHDFPEDSHGLGFELDQRWYMEGLASPCTAGHTGFTGPSIVIDPLSRSLVVLLANRVHPSRNWGSNNPARRALAQGLAEAMAVMPVGGPTAWFSGVEPAHDAVLRTEDLLVRDGRVRVLFDAFVDTEKTDTLALESSVDGGKNWRRASMTAHGRGAPKGEQATLAGHGHRSWWRVLAEVPTAPGERVMLRWRYSTDELYTGRGVYLDRIRVHDGRGVLLDDEWEPGRLIADGWRPAER